MNPVAGIESNSLALDDRCRHLRYPDDTTARALLRSRGTQGIEGIEGKSLKKTQHEKGLYLTHGEGENLYSQLPGILESTNSQ